MIDFLLTAKRDKASAKCFFRKALSGSHNPFPRVMDAENRAYPTAVEELKAEGRTALTQVQVPAQCVTSPQQ